jgi:adenosylcobinamide-GDP ribazoletransferase
VVGLLAGGAAFGVSLVAPHGIAVAAAFIALLGLTGAIHVDGFLDSCDALFASVPPERRLEILKDPRRGTYAIAGFAGLSTLWITALWYLPEALYPGALAFCGGTARWAMSLNAFALPYARPDGDPKGIGQSPSPSAALGWAAVFIVMPSLLSPLLGLIAPLCGLGALAIGRWAAPKLGGGLSGDVYGFGITILEVAALCGLICGKAWIVVARSSLPF